MQHQAHTLPSLSALVMIPQALGDVGLKPFMSSPLAPLLKGLGEAATGQQGCLHREHL